MKYPNVICRAILTVLIIVPLLWSHVAAEELDQAATNTALEKYEKWKTEAGTRTAVVAGGQTITLAWSEMSLEQWKAMCPDAADLIPK
jgi:uncharacterized membrane protein YqiK